MTVVAETYRYIAKRPGTRGGHRVEEALFGLVAFCGLVAVGIGFLESAQFVFRWLALAQLVSRLIG
jgi:hypothetical protein